MKLPSPARAAGFTLIEVMVVVVILGILATLIIPKIMSRPDEARQTKAILDIQSIGQALDLYRLDNTQYPTSEQGLKALTVKPEIEPVPKRWRAEGYLPKPPLDPWGNPYVYLSPGLHGQYDLLSFGADGMPGGDEKGADITSWNLDRKP
ncbi:MAG: type II secretion system major pseudopilin GspG [Magnetococcales bacterium]|nr:type II secretion system major pseudopilin GspG [Magnetococcales bacterium]